MPTTTKDAIFRFYVDNGSDSSSFEHRHPVPTFLCNPDPQQQASPQLYEAFIDILSVVTAEYHDECMSRITTPCVGCGAPAKDALKAPINCLNLANPIMIIQIAGWCGAEACEGHVRQSLIDKQNNSVSTAGETEKNLFLEMDCDVCKAPNSKRCAGCGQVAYCGADCQKQAWKGHRRDCRRKNLKDVPLPGLPYEAI